MACIFRQIPHVVDLQVILVESLLDPFASAALPLEKGGGDQQRFRREIRHAFADLVEKKRDTAPGNLADRMHHGGKLNRRGIAQKSPVISGN